jgi:hypothetical protein
LAIFKAIPVDTGTNKPPKTDSFTFKALPIEACLIKALPIGTNTNEPPKTDSFTLEALLIKALPVDTNKSAIPVKTDECNEPAILFANVIEPLMGTSIVDYCFTGSSIPESLLTTTLVLP